MKSFYTSISSAQRIHGSDLEALSEITVMKRQQVNAPRSDLGWQQWTE
jgi:hypothetical protein